MSSSVIGRPAVSEADNRTAGHIPLVFPAILNDGEYEIFHGFATLTPPIFPPLEVRIGPAIPLTEAECWVVQRSVVGEHGGAHVDGSSCFVGIAVVGGK